MPPKSRRKTATSLDISVDAPVVAEGTADGHLEDERLWELDDTTTSVTWVDLSRPIGNCICQLERAIVPRLPSVATIVGVRVGVVILVIRIAELGVGA